mgnify:CR=1 FL=1
MKWNFWRKDFEYSKREWKTGYRKAGGVSGGISERLRDLFVSLQKVDENNVNVITVLQGKTKEQVIWNGHLDTVPYGELSKMAYRSGKTGSEKRTYVRQRKQRYEKRACGDGICTWTDEKARPCSAADHTIFGELRMKKKGGRGAAKMIEEYGIPKASLLLIGEPTGCCLGIAQKGCVWLKAGVCGKNKSRCVSGRRRKRGNVRF